MSTACHRGYIGTWEILNKEFFLVKLEGIYQLTESPIFAEWFSGTVTILEDKKLNDEHGGFKSTSEMERLIKIKSGRVISETVRPALGLFY